MVDELRGPADVHLSKLAINTGVAEEHGGGLARDSWYQIPFNPLE